MTFIDYAAAVSITICGLWAKLFMRGVIFDLLTTMRLLLILLSLNNN